jgi:hypothetical protein
LGFPQDPQRACPHVWGRGAGPVHNPFGVGKLLGGGWPGVARVDVVNPGLGCGIPLGFEGGLQKTCPSVACPPGWVAERPLRVAGRFNARKPVPTCLPPRSDGRRGAGKVRRSATRREKVGRPGPEGPGKLRTVAMRPGRGLCPGGEGLRRPVPSSPREAPALKRNRPRRRRAGPRAAARRGMQTPLPSPNHCSRA